MAKEGGKIADRGKSDSDYLRVLRDIGEFVECCRRVGTWSAELHGRALERKLHVLTVDVLPVQAGKPSGRDGDWRIPVILAHGQGGLGCIGTHRRIRERQARRRT